MTPPPEIPGGYVILSRHTFDSYAGRPPWEFKLWTWMLAEANHQPKRNGQKLGKGQLLTTLGRMQEAVSYMVGARRVAPGKPAIAKYLRRQREGNSVETTKTTRGLIITICNYEYYQTAANYESNGVGRSKAVRRSPEGAHDRQEGKKDKKEETASAAKAPAKPRKPDVWWDAVCEVFGMTPITKSDKSRIGKLKRDFQAKCEAGGFHPPEINRRRLTLVSKWPNIDVTPEALLKWWDMAGGNGQPMLIALPSDQDRARQAQAIQDQHRAARNAQ